MSESTLKRHGYYCRSRRAGSTTRTRSCISCARGKARCDNRRPECSRCITKAIECHYPANTLKVTRPKVQHSDDTPTEQRKLAPSLVADSLSVQNRPEASNYGDLILDGAFVISDPDFANLGGEYRNWDDPHIDFTNFLNLQTNDKTVQCPSSGSSSLDRHLTPSSKQKVHVQQVISSPNLLIPAIPTCTTRSLIQRPRMRTGAQRIANLMFHTLKSYPLMMLRHDALPPFIHPRFISSEGENNHIEPLTNCISLVHMISSTAKGSRKLFWKNVQLECERLYEDVRWVCDSSR